MSHIDAATIAKHFQASCFEELNALKPGNVHIFAPGHRMDVTHFQNAAQAAAPHISAPGHKVGKRILRAVQASMKASGCNTNLGIILLCAPLARAAALDLSGKKLKNRLADILDALDIEDAANAFEAIRHASPAGLGEAPTEDVQAAPSISLREAMALAAHKDRIANAYVTGFSDIFELALPILHAAKQQCLERKIDAGFALTTLHMNILARFPDSHIERKHGAATAASVQLEAKSRIRLWHPLAHPETFEALKKFDSWLKQRNLNPGTTADMVVATVFADYLDKSLQ